MNFQRLISRVYQTTVCTSPLLAQSQPLISTKPSQLRTTRPLITCSPHSSSVISPWSVTRKVLLCVSACPIPGRASFSTQPNSALSRRPTFDTSRYTLPNNSIIMPSAEYRLTPQRKLSNNTPRIPFMIGVAGGTASGKSTVCKTIMSRLAEHEVKNLEKQVVSISQDSFYRELNEEESILAAKGQFNFDHPDAFDSDLMEKCLDDILVGKPTKIPVYDFLTNSRVANKFTVIYPSDVVLVEGILIFYSPRLREFFNLKLFVDADADTRLARRVFRDIEERGRNLEHVLNQYTTLVKPAFEEFCIPTKKFADVIVPRGAENKVAIDLIVQHIQDIIFRSNGSKGGSPVIRSRSNSESQIR